MSVLKLSPCPNVSAIRAGVVVALLSVVTGCAGSTSGGTGKTSASTLLAAGIAAENQGDSNAAKQLFQQTLAKDPKNLYAYYNLGLIAQRSNDQVTALRDYGLALAIDPGYVPALYNEGTIYGSSDPSLAMATYRRVIQLQPASASALLNLGFLEVANGQHKQGIVDFVRAIRLDPTLAKRLPHHLLLQVARATRTTSTGTPSPTTTSSP